MKTQPSSQTNPDMEQNIYPNLADFLSTLAQNSTSNPGGSIQSPLTDAARNFFNELGAFVQNISTQDSSSGPSAPPREQAQEQPQEQPQEQAKQNESTSQAGPKTQDQPETRPENQEGNQPGPSDGQGQGQQQQQRHHPGCRGFPHGRVFWERFDGGRGPAFGPWVFPRGTPNRENITQEMIDAHIRELSNWVYGIVNFLWTAGAGFMLLALMLCLPKFMLVLGTIFLVSKYMNLPTGPLMAACAAFTLLSELPHFVLVFFALWAVKKSSAMKGFNFRRCRMSSAERVCPNKDKCCYHRG